MNSLLFHPNRFAITPLPEGAQRELHAGAEKFSSNRRGLGHASLPALAAFALLFSNTTQATTESAYEEAGTLAEGLVSKGVALHDHKVGYQRHGQLDNFPVALDAGRNYVFLVGGCTDAYDLDAGIFDPQTGEALSVDADNDKRALVLFKPEETKRYVLKVQMADSTRNGAHYAILFGEVSGGDATEAAGEKTISMDTEVLNEDGQRMSLRSIMGDSKYLYIRMWATWCPPCIAMLPNLQARQASLPQHGFTVIAVNNELGQDDKTGGDLERATMELSRRRITVPSYAELPGGEIAQRLGVDSVPRSLIIDREGNVLYNGHPLASDTGLPALMEKLGVANFDLMEGMKDTPRSN